MLPPGEVHGTNFSAIFHTTGFESIDDLVLLSIPKCNSFHRSSSPRAKMNLNIYDRVRTRSAHDLRLLQVSVPFNRHVYFFIFWFGFDMNNSS